MRVLDPLEGGFGAQAQEFDRGLGLTGVDVRGEAADAGISCEAEVFAQPDDAALQAGRFDRRCALDARRGAPR